MPVVADGQGNVLSVIQSLYKGFGAGVVPPGTGVVLNNRGTYFNTDPAHPNVFAPRKRPFHTLLANLVTRDGAPVLGYATMGGDGQAMFHVQVLTNLLDYGMEIQEAIERPRFMYGRLLPADAAEPAAERPERAAAAARLPSSMRYIHSSSPVAASMATAFRLCPAVA